MEESGSVSGSDMAGGFSTQNVDQYDDLLIEEAEEVEADNMELSPETAQAIEEGLAEVRTLHRLVYYRHAHTLDRTT